MHPSARSHQNIRDAGKHDVPVSVNRYQMHRYCASGYCLAVDRQMKQQICRRGAPWELLDESEVSYDPQNRRRALEPLKPSHSCRLACTLSRTTDHINGCVSPLRRQVCCQSRKSAAYRLRDRLCATAEQHDAAMGLAMPADGSFVTHASFLLVQRVSLVLASREDADSFLACGLHQSLNVVGVFVMTAGDTAGSVIRASSRYQRGCLGAR